MLRSACEPLLPCARGGAARAGVVRCPARRRRTRAGRPRWRAKRRHRGGGSGGEPRSLRANAGHPLHRHPHRAECGADGRPLPRGAPGVLDGRRRRRLPRHRRARARGDAPGAASVVRSAVAPARRGPRPARGAHHRPRAARAGDRAPAQFSRGIYAADCGLRAAGRRRPRWRASRGDQHRRERRLAVVSDATGASAVVQRGQRRAGARHAIRRRGDRRRDLVWRPAVRRLRRQRPGRVPRARLHPADPRAHRSRLAPDPGAARCRALRDGMRRRRQLSARHALRADDGRCAPLCSWCQRARELRRSMRTSECDLPAGARAARLPHLRDLRRGDASRPWRPARDGRAEPARAPERRLRRQARCSDAPRDRPPGAARPVPRSTQGRAPASSACLRAASEVATRSRWMRRRRASSVSPVRSDTAMR